MYKLLATGLALGALTATSALAADLPSTTPAPTYSAAPSYDSAPNDWSGFYAGVLGGYGFGNMDITSAGASTNTPSNGVLAGLEIGANTQIDNYVLGIEGDINWSGQSGNTTCSGGGTCNTDFDWTGSVRARAGYAIDPALIYITGGVAVARANTSISPAIGGTSGSYSDTYTGWTVGAGVETALTQHLSAKLEYDYSNFGDRTAPANTLNTTSSTTSLTSHAIKVGLNYRF